MPSLLDRALNVGEAKKYKTYQKRVALINAFEPELEHDSDAELRERMEALRERARDGESLEALLPECFAVVRETGKRQMSMRHFDVQLIGACPSRTRPQSTPAAALPATRRRGR